MNLSQEASRIWSVIGNGAPEFWKIDSSLGSAFEPIEAPAVNSHPCGNGWSQSTLVSDNGIYITDFIIKGFHDTIQGVAPKDFHLIEVWTATPQCFDPQDGGGDPILFFSRIIEGSGDMNLAFLEFYKEKMLCLLDSATEDAFEHDYYQTDSPTGF